MHYVTAKGILSAKNGMNLYRGCQNGCIYCDSRSECYHMDHDFEDIEVKENALELLEAALRRKRKRCMIGTGAMTDPYLPLEKNLGYTRKALLLIEKYGFGVALQTKSDLVLRDLDILRQINEKAAERGEEKEEKQSIPLSVLLTADKIATEEIFKDGKYLDLERCVATLKNKGDVNENERAYEFIMSEVAVNNGRFIPDDDGKYRGECWGKFSDGYVIIVSNIFNRIAERGNFSRELFLQWAKARDLVKTDSKGLTTKLCRFDFGPARCIYLKMTDEMTTLDGFMNVTPEDLEALPFN